MPTATRAKTAPQFDVEDISLRCATINNELAAAFYERTEAIEALLIAILAKQHAFVLGEPGTAKSEMLRALCSRIDGAKFWSILMDRQLGKEESFGQFDLPAYDQFNRWERDITDTLGDAHLAFVDEVGKAGPSSLNPYLTIMQERLVKPGKQWVDAPLISLVGASNEYLEPELAAIWDRFLVRLEVGYIKEPSKMAALLQSAVVRPGSPLIVPTTITLEELQHVVEEIVPSVEIPPGVVDTVLKLRAQLHSEEVRPSDRRLKQSMRLLQASAFLGQRDKVDDDDLLILEHVLWNVPEQRSKVSKAVTALTSEFTKKAMEFMEMISEWEAGLDARLGEDPANRAEYGGEVTFKSQEIGTEVGKLIEKANRQGRSTSRLDSVQDALKGLKVKILTTTMNIDEDRARKRVMGDDA